MKLNVFRCRRRVAGGRAGQRRSLAFTLLELMLAIMIFSMVLTAIYAIWLPCGRCRMPSSRR